jgi:hypothetical protein
MNSASTSTADIVTILLTLFLGIVAWSQARKANTLTLRVAEAQGAFAKPTIDLRLFKQDIEQLVVAAPLKKGGTLLFPLPFSIENTSAEKSARALEVFIKMPKFLLGDETVVESSVKKVSGGIADETKYLQTLCVNFETLHPQQSCSMPILVSLPFETFLPINASDLVSKDGVRFNLRVRLEFEIVIDFWVTQLDQKGIAKSFGITVVDTSYIPFDDFLRENNQRLLKAWKRRPQSLFRRLFTATPKPLWSKPVLLVECRPEDIVPTRTPLVDTFASGTTFSMRVGNETDLGYTFPPLG